jgi:hypothetical protein
LLRQLRIPGPRDGMKSASLPSPCGVPTYVGTGTPIYANR